MSVIADFNKTHEPVPVRREKMSAYYQRNRERILARNRLHYQLHREERSEYFRKRYKDHKEEIDSRNEAYRKSHPERIRELSLAWQKSHPEQVSVYKRRWFLKNKDREKKRHSRYAKLRPEVYVIASQRRRALKKQAAENLDSIKEWMLSIKRLPIVSCYYCQSKIPSKAIHFDHIIPLSKGGQHSVENLCVSCASCNLSKHDKYVRSWIRVGQQVLEL